MKITKDEAGKILADLENRLDDLRWDLIATEGFPYNAIDKLRDAQDIMADFRRSYCETGVNNAE